MVMGRYVWVSTQRLGGGRIERGALLPPSHRATRRRTERKICVLVSGGKACSVGSTYLVVDGTNVLSKVYGAGKVDMLEGSTCVQGMDKIMSQYKPRDAFILWVEFLASYVGANAILCVFDHPANSRPALAGRTTELSYKEAQGYKLKRRKKSSTRQLDGTRRGAHLWEYKEYFKGRGDDWDMVISPEGYEADEAIRRIVHACVEEKQCIETAYHVYVASGDADLQECIDEHVSLLNILPFPTLTNPHGLKCVTLESFEWKDYFHPRQYRTFLALVGKSESGIGGVGMSHGTAAKLIRTFGTIPGMFAAGASGQLKSWDSKVQNLFSGKNTRLEEKLERNMRILGPSLETGDAESMEFNHVAWMSAGLQSEAHLGKPVHPMMYMHWDLIQKDACDVLHKVQSNVDDLDTIAMQAQLPNGLSVDAALHDCNEATLYLFFVPTRDIQYHFDTMLVSNIISEAFESTHVVSLRDPFKIQKSIQDRSIARYIGLLKRSNENIMIIPIYIS